MKTSRKALTLLCLLIFLVNCSEENKKTLLLAKSIKGTFVDFIETTGEVDSKRSVELAAPSWNRQFTINYFIPEGSFVKAGDIIARFDTADILNRIEKDEDNIENFPHEYAYLVTKYAAIQSLLNAMGDMQSNSDINI